MKSVVLYNSTYGKITLFYNDAIKIGFLTVEGSGTTTPSAQTITKDASSYCKADGLFVNTCAVANCTIEIDSSGTVKLKLAQGVGWVYGSVCFAIQ